VPADPPALARAALLVSLSAAASRILGFVRDVMIASALGAGPAADAFLAAYRIPNLARRMLTEGGLNAGFVPLYLGLRASAGQDPAARFARSSLAGFALLAAALTALVEIAAGPLVLLVAAGYADDPSTLGLAELYLRLSFPFVAGAALASLISAWLNAEGRFAAAALAPLAVNLLLIGALAGLMEAELDPPHAAGWLAAAVSLSGLLHLAVVGLATKPLLAGLRLRLRPPDGETWRATWRLLALGVPALAASGAAQLILLAGAQAASFTPSAVAWFYYAERVMQLPLGLIGAAAGIVLLAGLSRAGAAETAILNRSLEASLLVAFPAALALALLAPAMVPVLFERGAFKPTDSAATAEILAGIALALPFAVAGKILSQAFFVRRRLRPVLAATAAGVAAALVSCPILMRLLGPFGLGLGVGSGFAIHAAWLAGTLARTGEWRPDAQLLDRCARGLAASAVMAAGLLAGASLAEGWRAGGSHPIQASVALAMLCLGGLGLYGAAALALGAFSARDIRRYLPGWR
jgi:putative peptidoglycan lipid II flippase